MDDSCYDNSNANNKIIVRYKKVVHEIYVIIYDINKVFMVIYDWFHTFVRGDTISTIRIINSEDFSIVFLLMVPGDHVSKLRRDYF